MPDRPLRLQVAALIAIVALAIALRLHHAGASMAFDEMATLYFASQPWDHLWGWWMVRETNPPLFYSLVKLWCAWVPMGHWPLRALPLMIAFAHLALFGWFVRARLGWSAMLLGLLLFALSGSDIYQSDYLRGYGLAKLLVFASFIGLIHALQSEGARAWRGWCAYTLAATLAIYCHTTMVLWPVIVTAAVMADGALHRTVRRRQIGALVLADLAVMALSAWVTVMAVVQLKSRGGNISWLEPLNWTDTWATLDLQLLLGAGAASVVMGVLMLIGVWQRFLRIEVRLALFIVVVTLVLFKATDRIHPIISDFTLHWCFNFTALMAAAAMPVMTGKRWRWAVQPAVLLGTLAVGLYDLAFGLPLMVPQDWRATVRTVAGQPGAALLADHEAIGVVIEAACRVEFAGHACPFPLVVMADPRATDTWAFGGYRGRLVGAGDVRQALGRARMVYVFSRYYYTPLEHLGLSPRGWHQVYWDDGELIGPIPVAAFDPPKPGDPPRVPEPDAQYTGAPDDTG